MSEVLSVTAGYVLPFLAVFTVLVFVHELGHYLAAVRCGVWVRQFSVGIGPELCGWTDRRGTRWRIGVLPVGGYVKMFGEMAGEGAPTVAGPAARAFGSKPVAQRAFIVAAGPAANFLFAVVLMAGMFMSVGQPSTPAAVGGVLPGSAAERAGLRPGDVVVGIEGAAVERFEQVVRMVVIRPGVPIRMDVLRDGRRMALVATPDAVVVRDRRGNAERVGRLGISSGAAGREWVRHGPAEALWRAARETWALTGSIFTVVGQIVGGARDSAEIGGPIRIAQMSGDMWQAGIASLLMFAVLLSINLGLINLLPIPVLDGGHLLFYAVEAVRGRPLPARAQEIGASLGLGAILLLMLFVTWNDIVHVRVIDFLVGPAT